MRGRHPGEPESLDLTAAVWTLVEPQSHWRIRQAFGPDMVRAGFNAPLHPLCTGRQLRQLLQNVAPEERCAHLRLTLP